MYLEHPRLIPARPALWLVLAVATIFPAVLAAGAKAAEGPAKVASIEGITEYRLANGLMVLLYPDPSKPTVTVNLTVFVGSRHEGYGEAGMAHLLEHMLFKGTPQHPEIPKVLQERGARFNGTTWVDRTNYFETLPASEENLEFALRLEADRMVNSLVRQEDLLSEMTVVRNEFERGENSPANLLDQRMMSVAFDWHNYGKSTIGNRADIERVPIQNLKRFYVKYYQPDNAMLVVAGKFDEAQALALIQKYFGAMPKPQRTLDKTYTEEPPQDGERLVMLRRVGDVALVAAAYHVPSGGHPDIAALEVLGYVLDTAPSGRLYKALVETRKATRVSAGASSWHDPGVFQAQAEVRKEDSLDEAKEILLEVTENIGQHRVSEEEVARARQRILKQRELAAANTSSIAVQLSNWASQGDWRLYFLHRDRIEEVTPSEVERVAASYLRRNNRTLGMFVPSESTQRVGVPATPDLAELLEGYTGREQVAAGEAFEVSPQNIEQRSHRFTVADGIEAVFLPKKTRGETVHAQVVLRYGALESLKGYQAAAELLPPLMLRGTKQLSRQQIQDELDRLRATLTASGETGAATFSLQTTRANLPAVLELLRQIVREPSLPRNEFEVLARQQLAGLEEQLTDPQSLAIVDVRRKVSPYSQDDVRYVPTIEEEIARVKALTLEQMKQLYEDYFGPQAGEVAVVGDFDPDQNKAVLEETFGGWTSEQPYQRIPKVAFTDVPGGTSRIETPDKANATYVAGLAFAMSDTDPEYPAMVLGNFVLGGGSLSSRLGDRVRQKEGLSYGVGSMMSAEALDERASLTVFAIFNPGNVEKVETAIREEIERLLAEGVTKEELDRAKRGYLEQRQVSRTHDGSLANTLAETLFADRTMQFHADLEAKIAALNAEELQRALAKHVDPARLTIVTAGDFSQRAASGDGQSAPSNGQGPGKGQPGKSKPGKPAAKN